MHIKAEVEISARQIENSTDPSILEDFSERRLCDVISRKVLETVEVTKAFTHPKPDENAWCKEQRNTLLQVDFHLIKTEDFNEAIILLKALEGLHILTKPEDPINPFAHMINLLKK